MIGMVAMMTTSMDMILLAVTASFPFIIRLITGTGHTIPGTIMAGMIPGIIPGILHTMVVGVDITLIIIIRGIGEVIQKVIITLQVLTTGEVLSVKDVDEFLTQVHSVADEMPVGQDSKPLQLSIFHRLLELTTPVRMALRYGNSRPISPVQHNSRAKHR